VECHLGGNLGQTIRQEVRRPPSVFLVQVIRNANYDGYYWREGGANDSEAAATGEAFA
jgi:hypothetical protein